MGNTTMTHGDGPKGTMSAVGLQSAAGQFGLKGNISLPVKKDEDEAVAEIMEGQEIPNVKVEEIEEVVEEVKEEEVTEPKTTMKKPEEKVEVLDMDESFICPVCDREFSKQIGLTGHLRGPCGKKIKK